TKLNEIKIFKPEKFNWVRDIFEPHNVVKLGHQKGLIWKYNQQKEEYTFNDLSNKYNQFLNYLRNNGIETGDKMFSQVPLLPITWIGYLAAIKGGLVIIPAATTLDARDLAFRFESTFPEIALADPENAAKIDEAEAKFEQKIKIKLISEGNREGWININDLWKESTEAEAADTNSDDDLFYFFTSGTTGMPKIVVHTHYTYPIGGFTTSSWVGMKPGDLHYNISQPGWAKFFWSSFFAPWNMGATILGYHTDKFNPKEQLQTIQDFGVTTFCAPPTALRVSILEDLKQYNFKLRQCVAAGEPLNPEIIDVWKEGTRILIRDGYGQSESTAMIANLPNQKLKYGSMGKPLFLYNIVIADDDGNIVPDCEEGNICVVH
ncbi:MAG: AMP-binding protein, partial [Algoriella sp.]